MTEEQRRALDLAAYFDMPPEGDAVTIGLSDAELVARALMFYATALAAL